MNQINNKTQNVDLHQFIKPILNGLNVTNDDDNDMLEFFLDILNRIYFSYHPKNPRLNCIQIAKDIVVEILECQLKLTWIHISRCSE